MTDTPASVPGSAILVVVPTLNEERHIAACLNSLLPDAPAGTTIAVADGGSRDRTRAIVAGFAGVVLADNPARLQSAGINAAVAALAGPAHRVLVRCDAHAVYPPGYIARVADGLRAQGAAALVVAMDAKGETGFARAAAWIVDTPLGSGGAAHRGGWRSGWVDHGHHAGMDLGWFRRIGGYDPGFSHNEDAEYDLRLARAGGRIWMQADIRLNYAMRPGLRRLARQYWNYGRGRARTVAKHAVRPRLRQMIPVVNLSGLLAGMALAPLWPPAVAWPLAYVAALLAVSVAGAVALRGPAGLWAGPALGAMHIAWAAGFLRQVPGRRPALPLTLPAEDLPR